MSTLSQKKDVFEQISILKTASELSLNNIKTQNDIFSAFNTSKVKNNKDPWIFIVDLLTILAGSAAVTAIISKCFSSLKNIENSYKDSLKMEVISANGGSNANAPMPTNLTNGMQVHINKIDYNQELFTPQTDPSYNLYLDPFKQNLTQIMAKPNTMMPLNSSSNASYDNNSGYFTIKPKNPGLTFAAFMAAMIDEVIFIDPKILYNQTLDSLFNTQNKTQTQITTQIQIDTILNNLISETEEDDSYFTFDTQTLNDIEFAVNTSDQLYAEVGCGRVGVNLTVSDVANIASAITFPVSSKVISTTLANTSDAVLNSANNPNLKESDMQSVSNNFFSKFMNTLKTQIVRNFLVSPQMNIIYALSQGFNSNLDKSFNPVNDIQNRRALIKCMIKKLMQQLLSAIYTLLKKEILEIVAAVAILYAQESLEKYKLIITSLTKI